MIDTHHTTLMRIKNHIGTKITEPRPNGSFSHCDSISVEPGAVNYNFVHKEALLDADEMMDIYDKVKNMTKESSLGKEDQDLNETRQ